MWAFPAVMWKYRTVAVAFGSGTSEKTTHRLFTTQTFFCWWSKAATVELAAVMKCLFGWNTFSAVKTIYAYTPTARFIVRQDVSVFLICISNLNVASHTCGESPITNKKGGLHSKNPPSPLPTPHDFFANQLFFKQCEHHFMPDCNWCLWWCQPPHSPPRSSLKATGLHHLSRNCTNSTHHYSCCVSNQWGRPKYGVQWEQQ